MAKTQKLNMVKEENIRIEVTLIGSKVQKTGKHTVHVDDYSIVFINGKANVLKATAERLREEGLIE